MHETNKTTKDEKDTRRVIGVLAGYDTPERSNQLVRLFHSLFEYLEKGEGRKEENSYQDTKWFFENYHFVFTGGTFARLMLGFEPEKKSALSDSRFRTFCDDDFPEHYKNLILNNATILPPYFEGGVILLSQLVVQRQCRIIWSFLTPFGSHWIIPENLALLRLCDYNNVKKQMNYGSALEWIRNSLAFDSYNNRTKIPLEIYPGCSKGFEDSDIPRHDRKPIRATPDIGYYNKRYLHPPPNRFEEQKNHLDAIVRKLEEQQVEIYSIVVPPFGEPRGDGNPWYSKNREDRTIALIAHDGMKDRMVSFAIDYEDFLSDYKRIVTTGTTGEKIRRATRKLGRKLDPCFSGPKGGDIEIATQVLKGDIHTVIFFVDPSSPHAHIDDIRVVFGACMINPEVRMLTNEGQARQRFNDIIRTEKAPPRK